MTVRHWLKTNNIDTNKALSVTISTDGFSNSSNVMAVSATGSYPSADMGTAYVLGAAAASVQEHTEVSEERYNDHAMSVEELIGNLTEGIEECSFIVLYRPQYTYKWLMEVIPDLLAGKPYLDVIALAKVVEHKMGLPADVTTVPGFQSRIDAASKSIKGSYGIDAVCSRMIPGIDGDTADAYLTGNAPKLERQVYKLHALWNTLLDLGE